MISDFFQEYFVKPIIDYSGYNLVNTIVYAAILLFVSFKIIFPFFAKRGISFDFNFVKAVFPYIVLGSTLRIFEDLQLITRNPFPWELGYYFVSPGIYIMIGLFTIVALYASIKAGKKNLYKALKIFGAIGLIADIPVVLFLLFKLKHVQEFIQVLLIVAVVVILIKFLSNKLKTKIFKDNSSLMVAAGQAMDGGATFTALTSFSTFSEQHVVSNFLMDAVNNATNSTFFGPFAFLLVKIVIALLIIYFAETEIKDAKLKNFIKVFVIIIGFAPGIRDSFSLGVL
ncbi:MAG: DUF63 family protein [Candidatus Diapherotrites archaeon]